MDTMLGLWFRKTVLGAIGKIFRIPPLVLLLASLYLLGVLLGFFLAG